MKYLIIIVLFLISACTCSRNNEQEVNSNLTQIMKREFQTILDSTNLDGVILVYDSRNDKYYSNSFEKAKEGHLPASTFKIANSIIGLETRVIKSENSIFEWNGEKRYLSVWEKDLNLNQAFQLSCVPCFQDVARKIGIDRMKDYLKKLDYGEMEVDTNSLDVFWLEGNSKISPFQQIDFLKRFCFSELPITETTYQIVKNILMIKTNENYILSGKTGWSTRNGIDNGWFVGYVESNKNIYFFATNISPGKDFNMNLFASIRKKVTMESLNKINVLN